MVKARLALARSFLDSYSALPAKIQKKVRELTDRFQEDATRSGLNFEHVAQARDPKVRSLRVDQTYRAIVVQPPTGNTLLCVWVDHHDEAYQWARNKRFEVNPVSGTMQVYTAEEELSEAPERSTSDAAFKPAALFADVDDEQLLLAGVPAPLLASVRAIETEFHLDDLSGHLPEDAAEMLYLIAAGYDFMQALEEASRPKEPAAVDTTDIGAALERPGSQRTFHVVDGEAELEAMLDAPLEQWRVFLHPSQEKLVRMKSKGPVRVLGGAGTGKTVVLMHRSKYLLKEVFTAPEDRILVTTFTRNLAQDLSRNLEEMCGAQANRLVVQNLHAWAKSFYEQQVGRRVYIASNKKREELIALATTDAADESLSPRFYLEEWDQVIQPQEIEDLPAYLAARRVGRGTRLGRKERIQAWPVFERYRQLLDGGHVMEWQDVVREARLFIEKNKDFKLPYRAVLADEVQDLSTTELRLLRALVPKGNDDMYLVGDAHQRIYGHMAQLGACGIEIRGRARRLKLNYRTTQQIRDYAVSILEGVEIDDLDGGTDSLLGYRSLRSGPPPVVRYFDRAEEEAEAFVELLKQWSTEVPPESICVSARTNDLLKKRYAKLLKQAGLEHVQVQADPDSTENRPGIRLATMHRLKGLEFHRILLVSVHAGEVPLDLAPETLPDQASREDHEKRERCLFYVAATRARDDLVILGYGRPCIWLSEG